MDLAAAVETHTEFLLRSALGMGFAVADAEDLVQEAFTVFAKAPEKFEGRSSLRTYLYGILYRKGLERRRKGSRETEVDPSDAIFDGRFDGSGHWIRPPKGPEADALNSEVGTLIEDCLKGLTEQQRSAFHLKEVEQMSGKDVCNALDLKPTHLRVLLFRARNKTRECLEAKWESR